MAGERARPSAMAAAPESALQAKWVAALLPLFLLYLVVVVVGQPQDFQFDEAFYLEYAGNLARGDFSLPGSLDLWWGPGYPLVLAPFVWLRLPLLVPRLLNAFFLFGAVACVYLTLRGYLSTRPALIATYLFGIYPPMLQRLSLLMSEPLAIFLVAASAYAICRALRPGPNQLIAVLPASFLLGLLALTKVLFGYVFATHAVLFVLVFLWRRSQPPRTMALICLFSLVWTLPYLIHTFALTGKPFYWGSSGGMSLYWMSTPYRDELGDWRSEDAVRNNQVFAKHHGDFFKSLEGMTVIQRDDAFKRQALANIQENPRKYTVNIAYNIGRLLFSYPYTNERPTLVNLIYVIPNLLLATLSGIGVARSLRERRKPPIEIVVLVMLFGLALVGSALLSAYPRQFSILASIPAIWIAYSLASGHHLVKPLAGRLDGSSTALAGTGAVSYTR